MTNIDVIGYVIGIPLIFYFIRRGLSRDRRELEKIAKYFQTSVDWTGSVNLDWKGQPLQIYFVYVSRDSGRRHLQISWEVPNSPEWCFLLMSANKYFFVEGKQTIFEHDGTSWLVGLKQGDISRLVSFLKSKMPEIRPLYCRDFSRLKVAREIRVTLKGLRRVVRGEFCGMPDDCFDDPSKLIPYLDQLPQLVNEMPRKI